MAKEKKKKEGYKCNCKGWNGCGGGLYGLGFLGAAIYYISTATGFWMGVLGILKALVWPAFLVFELLKLVGA
jgi:hypothetical protein